MLRGKTWTEARIVNRLSTAFGSRAARAGVVRRLAAEGVLFAHPPYRAGGARRFALKPAEPEAYIPKDLLGQLKALCRRLDQVGIPPERVFAALRRGVEPRRRTPGVEELGGLILKAALEVKPAAAHGALVLLPELWQAVRRTVADKADFDRAVLHLAGEGRVDLHEHDHPQSLTALDRSELVTDGRGSWFVGLAIRS
jgi:hypothetical protein